MLEVLLGERLEAGMHPLAPGLGSLPGLCILLSLLLGSLLSFFLVGAGVASPGEKFGGCGGVGVGLGDGDLRCRSGERGLAGVGGGACQVGVALGSSVRVV